MTREPTSPFDEYQAEDTVERLVIRYLRWGFRHPHVLTILCLGTAALLFVVVWQLFGLTVGIITVAVFVLVMTGYWLSLYNAARR